ncbi:MAG: A/G-specific adenine glycosylase [Pseudomonadota bacterium]
MDSVSQNLLDWYDRHARSLPWRVPPDQSAKGVRPDPYHVWLSEVMLQQTTVAAVKSYFEKFLRLWPCLTDLATASEEDVMKAWAGLGYYSRARNLKACADTVAAGYGGHFPTTQADLIKLPGIGDYTSAAIAAIAFGEKAAVVDGNIERVITRLLADATPLPAAKEICRTEMSRITPDDRPGDFAQAMMDLGATICTPKRPACALCPLNEHCSAYRLGTMEQFPVKLAKKAKPLRKGAAFVAIREDGAVLLTKRADKGLLAGMSGVPTTAWTASEDGATGAEAAPFRVPSGVRWTGCGTIRHTFTHFHLELEIYRAADLPMGFCTPALDGWWSSATALPEEALPTVMKKSLSAAIPNAFKPKA